MPGIDYYIDKIGRLCDMIEKARMLLKKYYGYDSFRAGQEEIIASILGGSDTLAIMPTGAGKSVCFQIPALIFEGITIVISPLISLMKDQVDSLRSIEIPAAFINSTLDLGGVRERFQKAQNGKYKLLYIAPERLESENFCELIKELNISFIAIDEAHCVSQWGHDFRPSYHSIGKMINNLSCRPVVAGFTATATIDVRNDIVNLLFLKNPRVFVTGFDRENLFFSVVRGENKNKFVIDFLRQNSDVSGIIYAATRKEVDNLWRELKKDGYLAGRYHAGLTDEERAKSQEAFLYDDIRIMAATNAFGMGIDKSNVRFVIHYNMPKNMESYYQEAGRAGRDGEPSKCILLFNPGDVMLQKFLIDKSVFSPERKSNELKKLQTMVDYCHTQNCLRKYILEYFGEEDVPKSCGNCGNCNDDSELVDITVDAQKIFSCILRMKQRFGSSMVADVLKGSKNKKVIERGFDVLSTYGILKEYSIDEIKDLIGFLVAEEYLCLSGTEYPVVKLTKKAAPVLKGEEKVYHRAPKKEYVPEEDNRLFEMLRSVRRKFADEEKVPPYIIFSDSTLHEMSKYCPEDENSMLSIKGVGEMKLKRYGNEFLTAIKNYCAENGHPSIDETAIGEVQFADDGKIPSHIISLNMYKSGKRIKEIASIRGLKEVTVQDHLIRCFQEGMDVDLEPLVPPQLKDMILKKINELGCEKLKPLKEALPDEVDYMAIKVMVCMYRKKSSTEAVQ